MGRWKQKLVNAQAEVNRAVFLMNYRDNKDSHFYSMMTPEELSKEKILHHINEAIGELRQARAGIKIKIKRDED